MVETYTIKNVTQDLGFLLSLTKIFEADEDHFWYDPGVKARFVHKLDANDTGKEIVLFQDPMPKGNYYFFNPFAEGFGKKSPAVQFYYKAIRIALNLNIRTALLYMAQAVLESKEAAEAKTEHTLSHVVVRMSSIPIDKRSTVYDVIDEKMLDEFEKLFDRTNDECIHVPYMTQQMTAKVMCDALTDDQWDEKFGKDIRKKSLAAFKAALSGVLGIADPQDLRQFTVKYDPDLKSSAKFHCIMSVYLKLYSRFNDVLADAFGVNGTPSEASEINLGELSSVIDRFPLAYAIAKHMVQPVLPNVGATDPGAADTSHLRLGMPGTTRRFPGPEIIDDLGRKTRQGESLQIGRSADAPKRFTPHILSDVKVDPFAPAIRPVNSGGFNTGSSFGNTTSGGMFGNQSGGFGTQGAGLNLDPPSNFSSPFARRNYFG